MESLHVPTAIAAIHLICRIEHQRQENLVFNIRQLTDIKYQIDTNHSLIQKFIDGLSPLSNIGKGFNEIVTETCPYILWMLSAGEGNGSLTRAATSIELLNDYEIQSFNSHATTLHSLGLTYVIDRENDYDKNTSYSTSSSFGNKQIKMRLEPPIDKLIQFKNIIMFNQRIEIPAPVSLFWL